MECVRYRFHGRNQTLGLLWNLSLGDRLATGAECGGGGASDGCELECD